MIDFFKMKQKKNRIHRTTMTNRIPLNYTSTEKVMIINPDGSISYEPNVRYQQPTIIRRTYRTPPKPRYQYMIEQEGKSYRCCQWCRYWCTRRCPMCDICDRIFACPLLCCVLCTLFLLLLLAGLLTLFGLDPNINPSRRYYGVISTLSIYNQSTYIYGLDTLCNQTGSANRCLNLTTSTSIATVSTTIVINQSVTIISHSYLLLVSSLIFFSLYEKI